MGISSSPFSLFQIPGHLTEVVTYGYSLPQALPSTTFTSSLVPLGTSGEYFHYLLILCNYSFQKSLWLHKNSMLALAAITDI